MKEAVIVSAVRTPLGSFNGSLTNLGATQLGALVIEEAINRAGIPKNSVDEAIMGIVLPCGYGQNPAKQAAVKADMPWEVECFTINKVCGSGLKTVMLAAQAIQTGDADQDPDPFDTHRVDPSAFHLIPLVYSGGADKKYDIDLAKEARTGPYSLQMGRPADDPNDADGKLNHADNIHNHAIEAR